MDIKLTASQAQMIYTRQQTAMTGRYTDIPGNFYQGKDKYHFSWQAKNTIVIGVGGGPGFHKHFACTISKTFAITLAAGPGTLAVGPGGIDQAALERVVKGALMERLALLVLDEEFNKLGRSPDFLYLPTTLTPCKIEHDTREMIVLGRPIAGTTAVAQKTASINKMTDDKKKGQEEEKFRRLRSLAGNMFGFVIVLRTPKKVDFYRNYSVSQTLELDTKESLTVAYDAAGTVTLTGALAGNIPIAEVS